MPHPNVEAQISFRFKRLNKLQAFTLVREIQGSSHNKTQYNDCYVGSVSLTEYSFDDINDYFVRQRVNTLDCDILLSVNESSGSETASVPEIVNRMLKYIDCKLTISFGAS